RFEKAPVAKAAAALAAVTVTAIVAAHAAPISYTLPEETAAFNRGRISEWYRTTAPAALRPTSSIPRRAMPIQAGFLAGRGDQDDQGLRRADRRRRRRQDRRLSCRDLLSLLRPLPAERADPISVAAASNDRETGKSLNCAAISIISCRIAALFELPSSPQPAYPAVPDMPVCGAWA